VSTSPLVDAAEQEVLCPSGLSTRALPRCCTRIHESESECDDGNSMGDSGGVGGANALELAMSGSDCDCMCGKDSLEDDHPSSKSSRREDEDCGPSFLGERGLQWPHADPMPRAEELLFGPGSAAAGPSAGFGDPPASPPL
jgi:hypothetical protein